MGQKLTHKTSFWVILYWAACLLAMTVQMASVSIIGSFANSLPPKVYELLNHTTDLAIPQFAALWIVVSAAYIGVDRAKFAVETSQLQAGQANYGEPQKSRRIIILSGILLLASIAFEAMKDGSNVNYSVGNFAVAFGTSVSLYVAGMKSISLTQSINGLTDLNDDGAIDEKDVKIYEDNAAKAGAKSGAVVEATKLNEDEQAMADFNEKLKTPEAQEAQTAIKKVLTTAVKQEIDEIKNKGDK